MVWLVYFQVFAYSCPEEHPRISEKEKDYILSSLNISEKHNKASKLSYFSYTDLGI